MTIPLEPAMPAFAPLVELLKAAAELAKPLAWPCFLVIEIFFWRKSLRELLNSLNVLIPRVRSGKVMGVEFVLLPPEEISDLRSYLLTGDPNDAITQPGQAAKILQFPASQDQD